MILFSTRGLRRGTTKNSFSSNLIASLLGFGLLTGCATEPSSILGRENTADSSHVLRAVRNKPYNRPYRVKGKLYSPLETAVGYKEIGIASWYGEESGNRTASGAWFDPKGLTAAHKTLPIPSKVRVTNLRNGRSVDVIVNDRGPFVKGRLIDLSRGAAEQIGLRGIAEVTVEYIGG